MSRLREWWNRHVMSFFWFRVGPPWRRYIVHPWKVRVWWPLMRHTMCPVLGHRMGFSDRLQQIRKDCCRCWDTRVAERLIHSHRHPKGIWYVHGDAPWPDQLESWKP